MANRKHSTGSTFLGGLYGLIAGARSRARTPSAAAKSTQPSLAAIACRQAFPSAPIANADVIDGAAATTPPSVRAAENLSPPVSEPTIRLPPGGDEETRALLAWCRSATDPDAPR